MGMDVQKGPTAEQQAEIDRVVALFDEDWMIDTATKELRRKPRSWLRIVRDSIFPRRHPVFALYWWLKRKFFKSDLEDYMPFGFPVEHDGMPIPGYPMKYELVGEWRIPKQDLKYLSHGPLAERGTGKLLVTHEIGFERARALLKQWWAAFGAFAIVLGVVASLLSIFGG